MGVDLQSDLKAHKGRCDVCGEEFKVNLSRLPKLVHKAREILQRDESGMLSPSLAYPSLPWLTTTQTPMKRGRLFLLSSNPYTSFFARRLTRSFPSFACTPSSLLLRPP